MTKRITFALILFFYTVSLVSFSQDQTKKRYHAEFELTPFLIYNQVAVTNYFALDNFDLGFRTSIQYIPFGAGYFNINPSLEISYKKFSNQKLKHLTSSIGVLMLNVLDKGFEEGSFYNSSWPFFMMGYNINYCYFEKIYLRFELSVGLSAILFEQERRLIQNPLSSRYEYQQLFPMIRFRHSLVPRKRN
jgi:hypothetical protein